MSDEADMAQVRMEREEEQRRKYSGLVEIPDGDGACMNCGATLSDKRRWCDSECRDDYYKWNP
jgi:hypothetical protein